MNAKKCKNLRRLAQSMSKGKPLVEYHTTKGNMFFWGQRKLVNYCTRALYHQLKKQQHRFDVSGQSHMHLQIVRNAGL